MPRKLMIVTTVPITFTSILNGQPRWLSQHIDIVLVSSHDRKMQQQIEENEGVKLYNVNMTRRISPIRDLFSICRLALLMLRVKPDIVQSYTPKAGLVSMLAGRMMRVPTRVHTFTGLLFPTSTGFRRNLLILTDRLTAWAATHVVPEGRGVADALRGFEITSKPLKVVGNGNIAGVDLEYFSQRAVGVSEQADLLRRKLKLPTDAFVYGYIGRLNRDKGLDELVEAFLQQDDENSWLLCIGPHDNTAPPSARTMEVLNSHHRVITLGYVRDVRPGTSLMDVVILPSYREGFPNVLLQANAMAKPIIGTDIPGSNEIIDHGKNGWIVPPGKAMPLSHVMRQVRIMQTKERERVGEIGREYVSQYFEQGQYRQALLSYYRRVIEE